MNEFTEILENLSEAPETQIDPTVCIRLKALAYVQDPDPAEMLKILDDCVFAALASDFAMQAMHFVWEDMCKRKGLDSRKILEERNSARLV